MPSSTLQLLQLLQLADATFPIGAAAHSLGLETLTADSGLEAAGLFSFLQDYLSEIGAQEGLFCRAGYRLYGQAESEALAAGWLALNRRVSALRLARETRRASAMLGKRFLQLVCALDDFPRLQTAHAAAQSAAVDIHHAPAFGLAAAALGSDEEAAVAIYLQQATLSLISAGQRLMPLGQIQAAQILWQLKPSLLAAARKGQDGDLDGAASFCFPGLAELAAMRHPTLATRLFIS